MSELKQIKSALISVFDKSNLDEIVLKLNELNNSKCLLVLLCNKLREN